jgi:UDP-glucuronate decarboxylase
MQVSNILVTGAAGFLGTHLCEALLKEGLAVMGLDDESSASVGLYAQFSSFPRFSYLKQDVREPLPEIHFTHIYHLACPASPIHYQRDPVRTLTTNVLGTIRVLDLARRSGARVLLASTSEVYGDPLEHPQTEDYRGNVDTLGIRACYDEGKRCAETLVMDYHRQYGVNAAIARIFNTYGPGMRLDDGRVISNLVAQALRNEDVTLYGNGNQSRSFCFVRDLIDGLRRLMDAPRAVIGPINLGNPEEISIASVANLILKMTASRSQIVFRPLPDGDPVRRRPDITKASKVLSWVPLTNLEAGLSLTIPWFQQHIARDLKSTPIPEAFHASRL